MPRPRELKKEKAATPKKNPEYFSARKLPYFERFQRAVNAVNSRVLHGIPCCAKLEKIGNPRA